MCLPALAQCSEIELAAVILATGGPKKSFRFYWRKFKKLLKIGLRGALNGRRMRAWYSGDYGNLDDLCLRYDVPLFEVERLNGPEMSQLLRSLNADVGISLGNGYIAERIFSIPHEGMINVHSEILPAYQNAQSIIWPIFNNDPYTGFTIHEISAKIDAGRILYQRKYSLKFFESLEETVRYNKGEVEKDIPAAIAEVVAHLKHLKIVAQPQGAAHSYTTPSIRQFRRMEKNNAAFFVAQEAQK